MEEEILIERARIAFSSYLKLTAVMGVCLGFLLLIINAVSYLIQIIGGDPDATIGVFLLNFVVLLTAPLSAVITGLLSYPMYKWLANNKFSMNLVVYKLK